MKRCRMTRKKAGDKGTTIHRKPNGAAYDYSSDAEPAIFN